MLFLHLTVAQTYPLMIDKATILGIFRGTINNWNDPAIAVRSTIFYLKVFFFFTASLDGFT